MLNYPSISWDDFANLRLSQFVSAGSIRTLQEWEFMDRLWVGEAAGFTEWLRLAHDPNVLRSMALDFVALEDAAVLGVLEHLGLRLLPGMNREDLERTLGPPARVLVFPRATDRETLTFPSQGPGGYDLSCTVQRATGLSYLVVMRGDWASVPSP